MQSDFEHYLTKGGSMPGRACRTSAAITQRLQTSRQRQAFGQAQSIPEKKHPMQKSTTNKDSEQQPPSQKKTI